MEVKCVQTEVVSTSMEMVSSFICEVSDQRRLSASTCRTSYVVSLLRTVQQR